MSSDAAPRSRAITAFLAVAFGLGWLVQSQVAGSLSSGRAATGQPLLIGGGAPFLMVPLAAAAWVARVWVERGGFGDSGLRLGRLGLLLLGWAAPVVLILATAAASLPFTPLDLTGAAMQPLLATGKLPPGMSPSLAMALQAGFSFTVGTVLGVFFAFGQELAWRGYLLPRLVAELGPWRGVLLHGVVWGVWHAPLVVFGGYAYPGSPFLGLALWTVFCTLFGVLLAWLTFASGSLLPATLAHGVLIAAGETPLLLLPGADPARAGVLWSPVGLALLAAVLAAAWAGGGLSRGLARGPASLQRGASARST